MCPPEYFGGFPPPLTPDFQLSASLQGGSGLVAVCLHKGSERRVFCAGVNQRHLPYPGRRVTSLCAGPPAALYTLPWGLNLGFYVYTREQPWGS